MAPSISERSANQTGAYVEARANAGRRPTPDVIRGSGDRRHAIHSHDGLFPSVQARNAANAV